MYLLDTSRKIINLMANGRDNQGGKPGKRREKRGLRYRHQRLVMKGYDGTVEDMYEYYSSNVITRGGLVFKVESEDEALEALAVANASKFCARDRGRPCRRRPAGLAPPRRIVYSHLAQAERRKPLGIRLQRG